MNNPNEHINAPLFVERDYYDIPRAARMLGVEEGDIYHWISEIYIGLYVIIDDDFFCPESAPFATFEDDLNCWDARLAKVFETQTELSIGDRYTGGETFDYFDVKYHAGLWQVSPLTLAFYPQRITEKIVTLQYRDVVILNATPSNLPLPNDCYLYGTINPDAKEWGYDFVLSGDDVKRLYRFLFHGEPLDKLQGWTNAISSGGVESTLNAKLKRKTRTQAEHIQLIEALIKSHPDIDTKLLEQPAQLHKVLGETFARQGVHYPIANARTYSRWFKFE